MHLKVVIFVSASASADFIPAAISLGLWTRSEDGILLCCKYTINTPDSIFQLGQMADHLGNEMKSF